MEIKPLITMDDYKLAHSELIMYFQLIEHDMKIIFSYMYKGKDVDKNYEMVRKETLGQMVINLKELDFSDENNLLTEEDYAFLGKAASKRNFWAHQNYKEFLYEDEDVANQIFSKQCKLLRRDLDSIIKAHKALEQIRVNFCSAMEE